MKKLKKSVKFMSLLNKITYYRKTLLIALFFVVHLFLFNINVAEWGDSYRILRAAESIKTGFYPADEKRPPLFSLIIATRPQFINQIDYGRLVLLVFSSATFFVFYLLLKKHIQEERWVLWGMLAFLFNNIYLYWSIRIMADVPFGFFVLLALYLFELDKKRSLIRLSILGFLCGLAILTRFEGYILTAAIAGGLFLENFKFDIKDIFSRIKKYFVFFLALFLIVVPYLYFRNPLTSSYLEEPSGRKYDFVMLATYFISLLSIFGITSGLYVIAQNFVKLRNLVLNNIAMFLFLAAELALIIVWPAAVPRLFAPIIPIAILLLTYSLEDFYKSKSQLSFFSVAVNLGILVIYAVGQYFLKLQFLILDKKIFVLNLILQTIIIMFMLRKNYKWFFIVSVLAMSVWSFSIINQHKNIFISVKNAAEYAAINYKGNIAYNDVSSVSEWYLNYQYKRAETRGFYYNTEKKQNLNEDRLKEAGIDYLLITNEHNTTMTLDLNKRQFLSELKVFEYKVNGQNFVTRLVKVL